MAFYLQNSISYEESLELDPPAPTKYIQRILISPAKKVKRKTFYHKVQVSLHIKNIQTKDAKTKTMISVLMLLYNKAQLCYQHTGHIEKKVDPQSR